MADSYSADLLPVCVFRITSADFSEKSKFSLLSTPVSPAEQQSSENLILFCFALHY